MPWPRQGAGFTRARANWINRGYRHFYCICPCRDLNLGYHYEGLGHPDSCSLVLLSCFDVRIGNVSSNQRSLKMIFLQFNFFCRSISPAVSSSSSPNTPPMMTDHFTSVSDALLTPATSPDEDSLESWVQNM